LQRLCSLSLAAVQIDIKSLLQKHKLPFCMSIPPPHSKLDKFYY
jgi:hypothetical protein